jgi:hypothetical protein
LKSVDTRKELRDAVAAVEAEIGAHEDRIEALNLRLQGIRRAIELFESDQLAIIEMLRTAAIGSDGSVARSVVVVESQEPFSSRQRGRSKPSARIPKNGRRKTMAVDAKRASRKTKPEAGLKRVDMIAEALQRQPGLSTRELVAALDKDFGWSCSERNVTAHLYTNRRFQRTRTNRSGKNVVTWSLK